MPKPTIPLSSVHLRKLLFRYFSTHSNSLLPYRSYFPPPRQPQQPFFQTFSTTTEVHFLSLQPLFLRPFSVQTGPTANGTKPFEENPEENRVAESLSSELLKDPDSEPLPLPQRLDLSFSHITLTPSLILNTLNISPDAGRGIIDLLKWAKSKTGFKPTDEVYSYFVDFFGRRKDFKATHEVLVDGHGIAGSKCLEALVDRLVRAGRPAQTVALFESMEKDHGFLRSMDSLKLIVLSLCERGHASMLKKWLSVVFEEIIADLETLKIEYDEEGLALILLCSLPVSFSSFRDTILYSRDTLTIEEVYDALYSKEKMKHLISEARDGECMIAHGGSGRGTSKTKFSNQICNYCKKNGYLKKDCYKLQNKERVTASRCSDTLGETDIADNVVSDGELLAISDIESKPEEAWILDSACVFSACVFHMCPNKNLFVTYEIVSEGVVIMGNNASCQVAEIGTVRLKLLDGTIRTFGQVRLVPDLKKNLISLSTIDSKGFEFFGGCGALKVCKDAQIVLEGQKMSQLYIL